MADNEQYRGEVDGLLAKFGIPYRLLQMDAAISGGEIERRLSQWAQSNPNDPMAVQIQRNLPSIRDSLFQSVRGLRSGEDINPAVGRLRSSLSGGQTQGASNVRINDGGQDVQQPDEQARISDWIRQFTEEMSRNVGPGDPMFDSLSKLGAARASMVVGQSGVRVGRGGLGELAIQQGAMNATQPYVMQRKQMAQQGLGMMANYSNDVERLKQGAAGLQMQATGLNNQLAMQQFGQQQDAAGGVGGAIGGALGALGGGIATVATGGAAAPIIPGLIAGGAQAGAGFGQMSVPRPSMQTYRPYGAFGKPAGGF